jgi:hypothetical protein
VLLSAGATEVARAIFGGGDLDPGAIASVGRGQGLPPAPALESGCGLAAAFAGDRHKAVAASKHSVTTKTRFNGNVIAAILVIMTRRHFIQ